MERAASAGDPKRTVDVPAFSVRADIVPASINRTDRSVDVVWSQGTPVERFNWLTGERWLESLSLESKHVRLGRLNNGAPVLDSHMAFSLRNVIGAVNDGSAKVDGTQGRARIRFSRRADVEPIWQDVQDGIVRKISVGYRVYEYEETPAAKNTLRKMHATDWEPFEVSAVPIAADDAANIRSETVPTNPCVITRGAPTPERSSAMDPVELETREQPEPSQPQPAPAGGQPQPQPAVVPNAADRAVDEERARIQGILSACEAGRLPMTTAQRMIAEKTPLLDAQAQVLETLRGRAMDGQGPKPGPTSGRVEFVGADPLEQVWRGITGALLHRISPDHWKLDDNAKQYRSRSLLEIAAECLEQRGIRTRSLTKMELAAAAFGFHVRAGMHTTSDFPNLLADVANKSLRRAYDEAPATWTPIARRINMPDFKPVKRNQLGEAPALEKVLEHGEFRRGSVAEGKEQFQLATYGKIFAITRQGLVNDDLDAFGRLTTMFGRSARNLESDVIWYQILKNAAMADTVALFHATHNNLTSSGTAISIDSLGVGRALMRKQTGLAGGTNYLNLVARSLMVPPEKETIADQFTTAITPALGSSVNPFAGRLSVISEPRLAGGVTVDGDTVAGSTTAWYLGASTDQIDIIEYGFLDGEEGPVVESRVGFDIDGLEVKCRHDFAAKAIDFRGLYKNAGA